MKINRFCLITLPVLLVLACGRGKKHEIRESETRPVEVKIPATDWQKTIVIASADSDTVTQVLTASVARSMGRRGLKIIMDPSVDPSHADFVMQTKVVRRNDHLSILYHLQDIHQDSVIQDSVIYQNESMLTAIEAVANQVAFDAGDTTVYETQEKLISEQQFQQFLEAEALRHQATPTAMNGAVRKYKEILREDSLFTDAWIGLAECYLFLMEQGWERHQIWLDLAQQTGLKLQLLIPGSGEGECILGRVALIRGDLRGAEKFFRDALNKNSNLVAAWQGLGQIFGLYGLYDPALKMYDQVLELNPSHLQAGISKALILGGQGDYRRSIDLLKKMIETHPDIHYLHSFLALQLFYQGKLDNAMEQVRQGLPDPNYQPLSHAILAMIQAKQGDLDAALGEVELEVKPQVNGNGSLATAVAAIYTLIGRKGEAVQWLDRAVQWGYQEYPWLAKDPNFESIRNDERFQAICDTLKVVYDQKRQAYIIGN